MSDKIKGSINLAEELEDRIIDIEHRLEFRLDKISVLEDKIKNLETRKELQLTDEELESEILKSIKKYFQVPDIKKIQNGVIEASEELHKYATMIEEIRCILKVDEE